MNMQVRFSKYGNHNLPKLIEVVDKIHPDIRYKYWMRVLMGIYYETGGSSEGFELADVWSSGGKKYKGTKDVRSVWNRFTPNHPNPIRMGTLVLYSRKFPATTTIVISQPAQRGEVGDAKSHS